MLHYHATVILEKTVVGGYGTNKMPATMPIKLVPFETVALKMRAKSANTRNQCVFKTTLEPQDCGKTEIRQRRSAISL